MVYGKILKSISDVHKKILNYISDKKTKPLCSIDCWHYDAFGGEEGCGQKSEWGVYIEEVKIGEPCLYPKKRDMVPGFVISEFGLCAALEGAVIQGGQHDNTALVGLLTQTKK